MDFDEFVNKFNFEEICLEVENQIQDLLSENLSDPYEIGMFPEQDGENDGNVFITLDIDSESTNLTDEQAASMAEEIEQTALGLINESFDGSDLEEFKKFFSGVQIYLNGDKVR